MTFSAPTQVWLLRVYNSGSQTSAWVIRRASKIRRCWPTPRADPESKHLDSITYSMDMSLHKFQERVKDREAWRAADHGVAKSWTQLRDWTHTQVSRDHLLRTAGLHGELLLASLSLASANWQGASYEGTGCIWEQLGISTVEAGKVISGEGRCPAVGRVSLEDQPMPRESWGLEKLHGEYGGKWGGLYSLPSKGHTARPTTTPRWEGSCSCRLKSGTGQVEDPQAGGCRTTASFLSRGLFMPDAAAPHSAPFTRTRCTRGARHVTSRHLFSLCMFLILIPFSPFPVFLYHNAVSQK